MKNKCLKTVILEIKPGEGGVDAKLLVEDLTGIYLKLAKRLNLNCNIISCIEADSGWLESILEFSVANNIANNLLLESGGHRFQRVPPTEKRGRIQTSTVTVVGYIPEETSIIIDPNDIITFTTKDSGPGGQHRNKTESCVIMRHIPTGIEAKAASKSQHANKKAAFMVLCQRVESFYADLKNKEFCSLRKKLAGSGMRADKIRTYRYKDDQVIDHLNNKKIKLKDILSGDFSSLWK